MGPTAADDWTGAAFIRRTMRSAAIVGGIVVLVLASYGQFRSISPFLLGLGLSAGLLYAWELFARRLLTPEALRHARENRNSRRWSIVAFSLIKYPLVGLLLFVFVRVWRGDLHRAAAFLSGFILLHIVIGLRALGRAQMGRSA